MKYKVKRWLPSKQRRRRTARHKIEVISVEVTIIKAAININTGLMSVTREFAKAVNNPCVRPPYAEPRGSVVSGMQIVIIM